jgi:hypothetical protein
MKNSNDTIGNRTRDLPACSAVSHQLGGPVQYLYQADRLKESKQQTPYSRHAHNAIPWTFDVAAVPVTTAAAQECHPRGYDVITDVAGINTNTSHYSSYESRVT